MSEDLTKRLSVSDKDEILTVLKNFESYVRRSLDSLETWVGGIDARLTQLEARLGALEQKVEDRLHDTRPIWHKVVADIAELQSGLQRVEKGQEELHAQLRDLSHAVRQVSRDQIVINDVARRIQLDFHTIDERLHRLEVNRN